MGRVLNPTLFTPVPEVKGSFAWLTPEASLQSFKAFTPKSQPADKDIGNKLVIFWLTTYMATAVCIPEIGVSAYHYKTLVLLTLLLLRPLGTEAFPDFLCFSV